MGIVAKPFELNTYVLGAKALNGFSRYVSIADVGDPPLAAQSALTAQTSVAKQLGFNGLVVCAGTGEIAKAVSLQASPSGVSSVTASVYSNIYLASSAVCSSTITAPLNLAKSIAQDLLVTGTTTGDTAVTKQLDSDTVISTSITASLSTTQNTALVANLVSTATSTSELSKQVLLSKAEGIQIDFTQESLGEGFPAIVGLALYSSSSTTASLLGKVDLEAIAITTSDVAASLLCSPQLDTSLYCSSSTTASVYKAVETSSDISSTSVLVTPTEVLVGKQIQASAIVQANVNAGFVNEISVGSNIQATANVSSAVSKDIVLLGSIDVVSSTSGSVTANKIFASQLQAISIAAGNLDASSNLQASLNVATNLDAQAPVLSKFAAASLLGSGSVLSEVFKEVPLEKYDPYYEFNFTNSVLTSEENPVAGVISSSTCSATAYIEKTATTASSVSSTAECSGNLIIECALASNLISTSSILSAAINQNVVFLATLNSSSSSGEPSTPVSLAVFKPIEASVSGLVSIGSEIEKNVSIVSTSASGSTSVSATITKAANLETTLSSTSTTSGDVVKTNSIEASLIGSSIVTAVVVSKSVLESSLLSTATVFADARLEVFAVSNVSISSSFTADIHKTVNFIEYPSESYIDFTLESLEIVSRGNVGSISSAVGDTHLTKTLVSDLLVSSSVGSEINKAVPVVAISESSATGYGEVVKVVSLASSISSQCSVSSSPNIDKTLLGGLSVSTSTDGDVHKSCSVDASLVSYNFATASINKRTAMLSSISANSDVGVPTLTTSLHVEKPIVGSLSNTTTVGTTDVIVGKTVNSSLTGSVATTGSIVLKISVGVPEEGTIVLDFTSETLEIDIDIGTTAVSTIYARLQKVATQSSSLQVSAYVPSTDTIINKPVRASLESQARIITDTAIAKAIASSLEVVSATSADVRKEVATVSEPIYSLTSVVPSLLLIRALRSNLGVSSVLDSWLFRGTTRINPYRLVDVPVQSNRAVVPVMSNSVVVPRYNNTAIVPREKDLV